MLPPSLGDLAVNRQAEQPKGAKAPSRAGKGVTAMYMPSIASIEPLVKWVTLGWYRQRRLPAGRLWWAVAAHHSDPPLALDR